MKITPKEKKASKVSTSDSHPLPILYENELTRLIEKTAYSKAESDGFKRSPDDYWLEAEKEVPRF